jgi:hypothetical protein
MSSAREPPCEVNAQVWRRRRLVAQWAATCCGAHPSGCHWLKAQASSCGVEATTRLCTAPCEVTIAAGAETLAISVPGGIPLEAGVVTIPAGRFRVTGAFESRATLRTAGWLVAAGSLVLLTGAMYAAIDKKKECEPDIGGYGEHCRDKLDVDLPIFLAGCLGGGLGIGIGLRMAGKRDRPVVRGQATTNSSFMTDRIRGVAVQGSF